MNEEKEIKRLLNEAKSYFGNNEKIYIYKCMKCKKLDPVPGFIINEQIGFIKYIKKKKSIPKFECPYCGNDMLPLDVKE